MATSDDTTRAPEPLLTVDNLSTSFTVPGGKVEAVNSVSFTLDRGRTVGIVGESGSGKTVMSRTVMGLITAGNATITGSVKYNGEELVGASKKRKRQLWGDEMAMVFQDPMTTLNPVVKVGRQLTEHMRKHLGVSSGAAREAAIELLRAVRIPSPEQRFDNYPHQMSGGMRQRVVIAMAMACDPHLLFADEPTTALDVTVQHQILNLLSEQQEKRAMAMIFVTHDLGVVATRADDIIVMYAGQIVESAPTSTLFKSMRHPYTQALLWATPKTSQPKHTRLQAIPGRPPALINPPTGCRFAERCTYAVDKCRNETPELVNDNGHRYRCHFPVDGPGVAPVATPVEMAGAR